MQREGQDGEKGCKSESEYRRQEGIRGGVGKNKRCGGSFRFVVQRFRNS